MTSMRRRSPEGGGGDDSVGVCRRATVRAWAVRACSIYTLACSLAGARWQVGL